MTKYRKKPVEIEAWHATVSALNDFWYNEDSDHPDWMQDGADDNTVFLENDQTYIRTLEGTHHVSAGDFIIQGVKGELYPCKPDIFAATYELAEV